MLLTPITLPNIIRKKIERNISLITDERHVAMNYIHQTIVNVETGDCDVTEMHVALFTQKRACLVPTENDGNDVTEDILFDKPRILKSRLIVIRVTKIRLIIIRIIITIKTTIYKNSGTQEKTSLSGKTCCV
jgi:hypothetical protein